MARTTSLNALQHSGVRLLVEQLRAAERQFDAFARGQLEELSAAGRRLESRRQQLDTREALLMKQANRLADAKEHFSTAADERLHELENERATLALELATVRKQLLEHHEQAESQRRAKVEQRSVWLSEIALLRQAIQRLAADSPAGGSSIGLLASDGLEQIVARLECLQNDFNSPVSTPAA